MKRPANISRTASALCKAVTGLFFLLLAGGLLVIYLVYPFERPLPYCMGLLLGSALSICKVLLLERSLGRAVEMEEKTAQGYAALQAAARYLLTMAVFGGVVLFRDKIGLFGAILGVLSLQFAAYIAGASLNKREHRSIGVQKDNL